MKKKKVLIAEDNELIQKLLKIRLEREGFDIIQFLSGEAAFEYLKNNKVDVVLTDLYMPFLNGHQLIDKVRNELKSKVPIIVISGLNAEDSILKAFELGANDYLTKPVNLLELIARIKRLTRSYAA